VFSQRSTILAPNANWMVPRLERDFGDVAKVVPVPFGVDGRWFSINRSKAEAGIWLAVTRITRGKIGDLFDWGEDLFGTTRQLHLFGPMQETMELPTWVTWHGPTHPAELRDVWFPRANGLITLSRHDEGRPQVMLEAMAAGLPVIASNLPAHQDFIRHGETGWLAKNQEEFAEAITAMEDLSASQNIGTRAQRWIKSTIGDWDDCAGRYVDLYQQLLAD
jgi:glycosyltransferase involved in cell wall biosynthesis